MSYCGIGVHRYADACGVSQNYVMEHNNMHDALLQSAPMTYEERFPTDCFKLNGDSLHKQQNYSSSRSSTKTLETSVNEIELGT
ncbi:hypothetical protein Bhyg_12028, partial [Pseudolycoriella hygida]